MDIPNLKKFVINEVKSSRVKLHKEDLSDILLWISTQNIYQLNQAERNSYYIPEKNLYTEILKQLENKIEK